MISSSFPSISYQTRQTAQSNRSAPNDSETQNSVSIAFGASANALGPSAVGGKSAASDDAGTYQYSSLKSAMYGSGIVNPMDWLTAQDRQLVQQETGLTIKNGRTYDSNGSETYTQSSSDLINALYQIHQGQVTNGASGAAQSIGASDIANYIQLYADHASEGAQRLDTGVLTRAMLDLEAKDPTA